MEEDSARDVRRIHTRTRDDAIGVVVLEEPVDMARVQPALVERGVWIRPLGRLVYAMPPYVTSRGEVATITPAIYPVLAEVHAPIQAGVGGRDAVEPPLGG